ncbi:MAG: class IV adenylate cyclase [Candidatus Aminicenantaceae bacterium]|jgi:predicted adenylyl cyclase CyaB
MLEIEVKIKIEHLADVKEKILSQGAILAKERYSYDDTFYDWPSLEFRRKHHALRVRKINKKTFLTFKGPEQKSRKFKIREEYETEVKNERHLRKILKSLGLQPIFQYSKFRTVFRKKRLTICLDETPVGDFLELEGRQSEIVKFAHALNFSKEDFIKLDYVQLIQREKKS